MILVTVGTNEQPFDRLVRAAASLRPTQELVVQHGASKVPHGQGRWVDYLPFDELAELVAAADVVVSHAGVGSIILAHRVGKRALVVPPGSQLGPIPAPERSQIIASSGLGGTYDKSVDRESAYEKLKARAEQAVEPAKEKQSSAASDILFGRTGPRGGRQSQGLLEAMAKSAARTVGSQVGRELIRGVLGSLLGGKRR